MKTNDLENKLRSLKLVHLTEGELADYCNQQLAPAARARAEAHLKQCFICEELLELLREEQDASTHHEITAADVELVERLMAERDDEGRPRTSQPVANAQGVPVQERLTEYLRPMVASWKTFFTRQAARGAAQPQAPRRGSGRGKEVWQWQSDDGLMRAQAMAETRSDLTIHFYSSEMMLEGASFQVRLGPVDEQVTFQRLSDSELYGKVAVPRQGPRRLAKLSIEASSAGEEQ
ncbi:MAG TPA: hypothetical protein VKA60_00095 [Blastocatellia bacterium]|nr:hypothetical protein [Blastocatellia bacterium]